MRNLIILKLLFLVVTPWFSAFSQISNTGTSFSPNSLTITLGEEVVFTLNSTHNVVEVSQSTWEANDNTPLSGGFELDFGGGTIPASQLGIGTHYFVCSPHASLGMKGQIIVENATSVEENSLLKGFTVFPNPSNGIISIRIENEDVGSLYQINDLIGREVMKGKLTSELTEVDISGLNQGTYLVQTVGINRKIFKIIKN